jgi:hypothetical protein
MPKMRWADAEAFDDLPEEWDEAEFEPYDGDEPPPNIALRGKIKKIWAVQFSSGNDGFKVLFEAAGNTGEREEYDGWGVFDNVAFTPGSAFRYGPLLELLGVTLSDVKSRSVVGEEDNTGFPVTKIAEFRMPADGFPCKIRTKTETNEEYGRQTKVGTYMPDDAPKRGTKAKASSAKASGRPRRRRDEDDDEPF